MARDRAGTREAYAAKTRAEIASLAEQGVLFAGNAFSSVTLVKGEPEADGAAPFSGPDGRALRDALMALGYAPEDWSALLSCDADGAPLADDLFLTAIMALDPATLILCDEAAADLARNVFAEDLARLADFDAAMLAPGALTVVRGIRTLNLGGFAAALGDNREKQIMWRRLKTLPPLGEPY